MSREKSVRPYTGKKASQVFSALFLHRRNFSIKNRCEGTDDLQRGSGNQYGCGLYHVLGRIRRFQREHGSRQVQSRWAYAKRLNTELARRIAAAVTAYALENRADVIVFEYLEMSGRISGNKKQKLHLWRKRDIQKLCEHQAHRKGIRISRVSARNTSRLAYDGSGAVVRDPENHSLCTFQTGKRYNCDLSAAYNIGARYFIRELLKPFSETERSSLEAKVPSVKRRTSCVYADLRLLHAELEKCRIA